MAAGRAAILRSLSASRLFRAQRALVDLWHEREKEIRGWEDACARLPLPPRELEALAAAIARINTYQWHEEDQARDVSATDAVIARIKRSIDRSNQRRVDAIEAFDSRLEALLAEAGARMKASGPLNSETPGSLVDRLSILALKLYHMSEQRARAGLSPEQRRKFAAKVSTLQEQAADLQACLDELVAQVLAGRRRFKTYYQLKMYNDPETNPYLRKKASS